MIGTYGSLIFRADAQRVLTPRDISRSSGSQWATHEPIGAKAKAEYLRPNLRTVSYTIQLDSSLGVRPRAQLGALAAMAETGYTSFMVVGGRPLSQHPLRLMSVDETWNVIYSGGELASAEVSLTLEEYV